MMYPDAHLLMLRTQYASYPYLRIRFEDETVYIPQLWCASPPKAPVPL